MVIFTLKLRQINEFVGKAKEVIMARYWRGLSDADYFIIFLSINLKGSFALRCSLQLFFRKRKHDLLEVYLKNAQICPEGTDIFEQLKIKLVELTARLPVRKD